MLKNILFVLLALLTFTFVLNTFDNSGLQMREYSNICHSIYSEKYWIDTCNLPIAQNTHTYLLAMKVETGGIILVLGGLLIGRRLNV